MQESKIQDPSLASMRNILAEVQGPRIGVLCVCVCVCVCVSVVCYVALCARWCCVEWTVQCGVGTVYYVVCIVYCVLCTVYCILYTVYYVLYTIPSMLCVASHS
jgi:hypothetical protein